MDETLREQIALFRYGVVNELVSRPLAPGEKQRLLEAIAEKEWDIPGSRRRQIGQSTAATWVKLYEAMGFDGLKPRPRSDKGASRALPEPVQELLLQLRRERPKAAVTSLIRAARLSGRVDADVSPAPSTLYRLFSAHGLETKPTATTPDAKAFTHPHANDLWLVDVLHDPYDPTSPVYLRRRGEVDEHRLRPLDLELNSRLRRVPRDEDAPDDVPETGISYLDLIAQKHEESS